MFNTIKIATAHHLVRRRKEVRLALLLLALAAVWVGANHISSFVAGFFDGATGV
ncbi:hypothetical protein J7I44_04905 [Frateuria sp. MAH-13]|uniref:Uncharacterized protein n=1 Tax=Frateuria flava TaxID=2821489 RepID=A0ABS4DKR5_9GAMM|nr:hypothetical protein [Frateuria flava]MBP1473627.1 hypothetical protein [Frateuria flava]